MNNRIKTREEVEELKRQWKKDPTWDIYETEGFEAYRDELVAYQTQMENEWTAAYTTKVNQDWLRKAKDAWITGDDKEAQTLAAIAQADALAKLAGLLEATVKMGTDRGGNPNAYICTGKANN